MRYGADVSRFEKEMEAVQSLARLYDAARACKNAHQGAGLKLPESLVRFFGEEEPPRKTEHKHPKMTIPPPPRPPAPPEAGDDWIWIEVPRMKATGLVLGTLRSAEGSLQVTEIFEAVQRHNPAINKGTIANIGTRLSASKQIKRDSEGWSLTPGTPAPIFYDGYAWGPVDMFEVQELAAHRRAGILHLLRTVSDGMQIMQITNTLAESCPWNRAPVAKDIVKVDMAILRSEGLARKMVGHSGKWGVSQ